MTTKRARAQAKKAKQAARSQAAKKGWKTRESNMRQAAISAHGGAREWNEFLREVQRRGQKIPRWAIAADKEARRRRGDEEEDFNEGPVWEEDWEWDY